MTVSTNLAQTLEEARRTLADARSRNRASTNLRALAQAADYAEALVAGDRSGDVELANSWLETTLQKVRASEPQARRQAAADAAARRGSPFVSG